MDKLLLPNPYPGLHEWNVLLAYRGSIAHNTHAPSTEPHSIDDIDLIGMAMPTLDYYFGLKEYGSRGTVEIKRDELDIVIYETRKFVSLLASGNANVLSVLWLRDDHYINLTSAGKLLIQNRDMFVGSHVYNSFTGYARGQRHKMTHQAYQGYMGDKRRALVDQFGYDTKNAGHLIRLLRMLIEFLGSGEMQVYRTTDSEQLKDIKRGKWTLEQVHAEADMLLEAADEALRKSTLPNRPDREAISRLLVLMSMTHLRESSYF